MMQLPCTGMAIIKHGSCPKEVGPQMWLLRGMKLTVKAAGTGGDASAAGPV